MPERRVDTLAFIYRQTSMIGTVTLFLLISVMQGVFEYNLRKQELSPWLLALSLAYAVFTIVSTLGSVRRFSKRG